MFKGDEDGSFGGLFKSVEAKTNQTLFQKEKLVNKKRSEQTETSDPCEVSKLAHTRS